MKSAAKSELKMAKAIIGIIGGSGLYSLQGFTQTREETIATPWGEPSDALRFGRFGDIEVVFLARHGRGHRFSPSTINYRANIDALKRAGVTDIVAISACGSYKRELYPGLFVLADQFIDRTFKRETSFFGTGCVAHVPFSRPISDVLRKRVAAAAAAEGVAAQQGGTYVCMEGPQFSTYAESLHYQSLGAAVIGMTAATEAKLAREAEIAYALIAMVTDFDCWHDEYGPVNVASVMKVMRDNAEKANRLVARVLADYPAEREPCPTSDRALDGAVMTAPEVRDVELVKKLDAVAGRVLAAR
jgi:5'-methylthioadenosine phosphorylase